MKRLALPIFIWVAVFCLSFSFSFNYFSISEDLTIKPTARKKFQAFSPGIPDSLYKPGLPDTEPGNAMVRASNRSVNGQNLESYAPEVLANTPHKERMRRTLEYARTLYTDGNKKRAGDLLETSVIQSALRGDPLQEDALNLLRDIYSGEVAVDGYERLLAAIPQKHPGRPRVVHHAVLAYLDRGGVERAYLLIRSQLEKTGEDPALLCDLEMVKSVSAARVLEDQPQTKQSTGDQDDALTFYLLGSRYVLAGEEELARNAFDNAVRLDPSYADRIALDLKNSEKERCLG